MTEMVDLIGNCVETC